MKREVKRQLLYSMYVLITITLITVGVLGVIDWLSISNDGRTSVNTDIITNSVETPSEDDVSKACSEFRAADNDPERLRIDAIGVDACIQKVGVDQHGAMAVPPNIYLTGWYIDSALPGEEGVSVIDGHVLGRYNDAVFAKLDNVKSGDRIAVEYGNASTVEFEVVQTRTYTVDEVMNHIFEPLKGVTAQLNLITCTGTFDAGNQTYDRRLVVQAHRI